MRGGGVIATTSVRGGQTRRTARAVCYVGGVSGGDRAARYIYLHDAIEVVLHLHVAVDLNGLRAAEQDQQGDADYFGGH